MEGGREQGWKRDILKPQTLDCVLYKVAITPKSAHEYWLSSWCSQAKYNNIIQFLQFCLWKEIFDFHNWIPVHTLLNCFPHLIIVLGFESPISMEVLNWKCYFKLSSFAIMIGMEFPSFNTYFIFNSIASQYVSYMGSP